MFLFSCSQKTFDSEKEFLEYLNDKSNGYIQYRKVNDVDFKLIYKPTDLLVKQEMGDRKLTKKTVSELRSKYSKHIYFNLSISRNNQELLSTVPKNRNEFGAMVNDLSFGMQSKVHLYTRSKDTIEMTDFIYPRMYGMSRATTIMFVYPRDKNKLKEEFLNFTIEDLGSYTGEVKFKIETIKINDEPMLKLN